MTAANPGLSRRFTFVLFGLLGLAATASSQTIQPLVAEYRGDARGRIELVNQSDQPLNVVVEPKGFRVDEQGTVHDEPLPGDLQIRLSASSLRIPPRQNRFVFYEATSTRRPAWFALVANFTGYPRQQFSGLNVQLELPHFVYVLPRDAWKADDIQIRSATIDRETHRVVLIVENRGQQFGRIEHVEVRRNGQKASEVGFPLFPESVHRVELPWEGDELPAEIFIRAKDFNIERPLALVRP